MEIPPFLYFFHSARLRVAVVDIAAPNLVERFAIAKDDARPRVEIASQLKSTLLESNKRPFNFTAMPPTRVLRRREY